MAEEADVFRLAKVDQVVVDDLAQELVVVAEAIEAFVIEHLEHEG